jgi:chloramphenicol 3-O phosphotransferase
MKHNFFYKVLGALFCGILLITLCSKKRVIAPGKIVILNGPSCVGKSSIIKALQTKTAELWVEAGIDKFFVGVLAPKWYLEDKAENYKVMHGIADVDETGNAVFVLQVGVEGQKVVRGMHGAIAAYAKAGCNVIVDYICYEPSWREDLLRQVAGLDSFCVGLSAPLEVLEARETARATSPKGHSRSHHASVHNGWQYDLCIDTSCSSVEESAAKILALAQK